MDSRAYIFIFPVDTPADIPEDFRAAVQGRSFDKGIFLPQDDTNWFTRPPRYPARLLLLDDRRLYIIPHSTSGQGMTELNLEDLVQLETGTILLLGWIQLTTKVPTERLIYNTRGSRALELFVAVVRRRWLGEPPATNCAGAKIFGEELDIEFKNLLDDSLDRNECVLSQCFRPPAKYQDSFLLFRRVKWRPGHLIVLTSGNRVLWLKDEYRGRRERYSAIAVSAPVSLLRHCGLERTPDRDELVINFATGPSWRISTDATASDWAGFPESLTNWFAGQVKDQEIRRALV